MWLTTLALVAIVLLLSWAYSKYRHNYWASRSVPTVPGSLPFLGHVHKFMRKSRAWEYVDEVYKKHGGSTFCGFYEFLKPNFLIGDPDLAKAIFIKDFDYFVDRRNFKFTYGKDDIFNHFLTNATGSHWKGVRSVLSPSFTSGRMKGMFPLVGQKADALVKYIHKQTQDTSSLVLKKTFGHYAMEVIASCAFGMESGAFEDENSLFSLKVADLFKFRAVVMLKTIIFMMFPKLFQFFKISIMQESMSFFIDVVKESITQREAGLYRGDFLDLMLEAREDQQNPSGKLPKYPLTDNMIVANSVLFIMAGFDTTANTLSFFAFLLAKHPEIQKKLRKEIKENVDGKGELTYQGIMEAKFLDACLSETLRMYPPAHVTERQCTKEYKVPGTDVVIQPKILVGVPIYSIHHDERYWPEPEEFRPERFLPENKEDIKSGTYLPFGLGPRNCIGMRFAQMEAKLAIAKILLDFELSCVSGHEEVSFGTVPGIMRPSDELSIAFNPLPVEG